MAALREITLDTETTGLDPRSGHRIVEIGCVELMNGVKTGKVFHSYINPERDVPEEARRIHGIETSFLADKPKFHEIAEDFLAFIAEDVLVIHNVPFDLPFINWELQKIKKVLLPFHRTLDTLEMARKKFPGAKANLDALCARFSIDTSKRTYHGALLDAELLAEVYLEMMGGRQRSMLPTEDSQEKQTVLLRRPVFVEKKPVRPVRSFPVSEEELAQHAAFVQTLKNPLWLGPVDI